MWCVPNLTPEFRARMEDVLALYEQSYDPAEPVVCFDEKAKELHREARNPLPSAPGMPLRRDYEYVRNGTANCFVSVEPKAGRRRVTVTERRTKADFAREISVLVTRWYRTATRIHLVLDNLNTHGPQALVETFGTRRAAPLLRKLAFHHTPVHASWLNMAEIEVSILARQCLNRRIPTCKELRREVSAWQRRRNRQKAQIHWRFTRKDARKVFASRASDSS